MAGQHHVVDGEVVHRGPAKLGDQGRGEEAVVVGGLGPKGVWLQWLVGAVSIAQP